MAPPGNYPALLGKLHTEQETVTTPRWVTLFSPYFAFWLFSLCVRHENLFSQLLLNLQCVKFLLAALWSHGSINRGAFQFWYFQLLLMQIAGYTEMANCLLWNTCALSGESLPVAWFQIFLFILFRKGWGSWKGKVFFYIHTRRLYIILFIPISWQLI